MMFSLKKWFLLLLILLTFILSIPEINYKNVGESKSIRSVRNGQLENAYILPYSGKNFRYFSPLIYYIANNGYTHSTLHNVVLEAYEQCEKTCQGVDFKIMESTDRYGGKLLFHRTHQNGLGIDFMIPKLNAKGQQTRVLDWIGMWHYLLSFDEDGHNEIIHSVSLDFNSMARHIIAIDDAAVRNGLRIRKIILKIELKDNLYNTEAGQEILRRGIYIVNNLSDIVNEVHDDHFHIDFEII